MISYRPLFETMAQKNITSYALFKMGFSKSTYHSIKKGNSISTNTVNQLCKLLNCSVSEIIEFVDDEEQDSHKYIKSTFMYNKYSYSIRYT